VVDYSLTECIRDVHGNGNEWNTTDSMENSHGNGSNGECTMGMEIGMGIKVWEWE